MMQQLGKSGIWKKLKRKTEHFYSDSLRWVFISGGSFLAALVISLSLFIGASFERGKHLLFFFEYNGDTLVSEVRSIPWKPELEARVQGVVEELLWGPMSPGFQRLFPFGSRVQSVLVRSGTLYVDLSPEVLFSTEEFRVGWNERLGILKKSITFNYPNLTNILLTVNGQIPGVLPHIP